MLPILEFVLYSFWNLIGTLLLIAFAGGATWLGLSGLRGLVVHVTERVDIRKEDIERYGRR